MAYSRSLQTLTTAATAWPASPSSRLIPQLYNDFSSSKPSSRFTKSSIEAIIPLKSSKDNKNQSILVGDKNIDPESDFLTEN